MHTLRAQMHTRLSKEADYEEACSTRKLVDAATGFDTMCTART